MLPGGPCTPPLCPRSSNCRWLARCNTQQTHNHHQFSIVASKQDRVVVWASQLKDKDLPHVCAVTGAPAETWYRVRFKTVPGWAEASHALAFTQLAPLAPVLEEVTMRRARGYLPVTRHIRRQLLMVNWSIFGLLPLTLALCVAAAVVAGNLGPQSALIGPLVVAGILTILAGLIGLIGILPLVGPGGRVFARQRGHQDNPVELFHVHPAFVTAVQQLQLARAQSANLAQVPSQPNWK